MKEKILGFLGAILISMGCAGAALTPVQATGVSATMAAVDITAGNDGRCDKTLVGFRSWYYTASGSLYRVCEGGQIKTPDKNDTDAMVKFVWTIILNISFDLTLAIGYIAVGMVIYGGYMYIMSQGDPGKAAKGQATLTSAVIGVVIAMGASVIVNTAQVILGMSGGDAFLSSEGAVQNAMKNIFPWAYTMAGLVAVVFIIKGGVEYMISRGDPSRVQKATRSLVYAVVGLIIVILAAIITSVVTSTIGGAL